MRIEAQGGEGPTGRVRGGVGPNVDVGLDVEAPHGGDLAVQEEAVRGQGEGGHQQRRAPRGRGSAGEGGRRRRGLRGVGVVGVGSNLAVTSAVAIAVGVELEGHRRAPPPRPLSPPPTAPIGRRRLRSLPRLHLDGVLELEEGRRQAGIAFVRPPVHPSR